MSVKAVFDQYAGQYDESRRKLIPCFADFYRLALESIPFAPDQAITVLELGTGTGLLTAMVADRFANARFVLIDISANMLAEARKRLGRLPHDFTFLAADYAQEESFGHSFDLIISSLSIHHLAEPDKWRLFRKCHAHLTAGGIFINADQVLGDTEEIDKIYRRRWVEQVTANGITAAELQAAQARMAEDRMSTLAWQLAALRDSGFRDVNCWYKNYSFAVYSGRR